MFNQPKYRIVIDLEDFIEEDGGWLLLARHTLNDRTMIFWYNSDTEKINMSMFHAFEQPNDLSRRAKESQWGWMTLFVDGIESPIEATEIANKYLADMENDNFWWEGTGNTTH